MHSIPVIFNGKSFPSFWRAWKSVANIPGVVGYETFINRTPTTLEEAMLDHHEKRLIPLFRITESDSYALDTLQKIIKPDGPQSKEDAMLLQVCIDILNKYQFLEMEPRPEPKAIPTKTSIAAAEYIIKELDLNRNLDDAEKQLLTAAKLEIQNYNSRIVKSR